MTARKDAEGVIEEGRRTLMPAMSEIIEWLAGDECHELDSARLATELGRRLRATGLPLDHLVLYLRTLHPEIRGRTIAWTPDGPVQIHDRSARGRLMSNKQTIVGAHGLVAKCVNSGPYPYTPRL